MYSASAKRRRMCSALYRLEACERVQAMEDMPKKLRRRTAPQGTFDVWNVSRACLWFSAAGLAETLYKITFDESGQEALPFIGTMFTLAIAAFWHIAWLEKRNLVRRGHLVDPDEDEEP
jgi:hypothetical protein